MCTVVSSWLRSSYTGSSSCGLMKQGVLPMIIFADLPVLRYVPCAAVSRSIAKTSKSWRIKSHHLQDSHNRTPWNTLKLTKKTQLVDTQDRKLSRPCIYSHVDMKYDYVYSYASITLLRSVYVRDVQTPLQSTVLWLTKCACGFSRWEICTAVE